MDFIQVLVLFGLFNIPALEALKCATDDGVTDEEVRKISRVCMKKAASSYGGNSHNNFNGNLNNKEDDGIDFLQQRNMQRNNNRWNTRYRNENQFGDYQYYGNRNDSASNQNRGHQANRSCIFHCFFQEMGMLKTDEFPDKHKVLHVLTNEIRDREIRNFYVDTIQECFMHLEMQQKTDKCQFSTNLVNCMVDYGRINCDDWQEDTTIFM